MTSLANLMANAGLEVSQTGDKSPQGKAVFQAQAMLNKLDNYGTQDKKLNYSGSNQLWWSGAAVDGKRAVRVYYGNKVMKNITEHGETDFGVVCDDSIEAVREAIQKMKVVLESKEALAAFEAEEARRAKLAEKTAAKKQ